MYTLYDFELAETCIYWTLYQNSHIKLILQNVYALAQKKNTQTHIQQVQDSYQLQTVQTLAIGLKEHAA